MKRLIILAFMFFSFTAIDAQEVSENQWTMVSKVTADWCPLCGGYGWTFKNYLLEDNADKDVVVWMLHYSGGLKTPTAEALTDNLNAPGQPVFYINNDNMNVNSSNLNAKRDEFNLFIESLNSFTPFAGVGSTATFDGEKIVTVAKAKFLSNLEGGEYWLSSYLVDDELIAPQASQGSNAKHENVLLHSFNGSNYFGENIITGAVEANQEFTVEGMLDFSDQNDIPDYADGYSIVTVLWTKVGEKYTPLNLNKQPIVGVVGTNEILSNIDISAFYLGAGQINLNINSDQRINSASIHLFDMNGRNLASKNEVYVNAGKNQLVIEAQELTLGTYVVVIESEMGSKSIKLTVK